LLDRFAELRPPASLVMPAGMDQLTERELEVLRQMARGLSTPRSPASCT
jgi:DNA-binding CsgD family transcriptional regulator